LYNNYVFREDNLDQANSIDSKFRLAIIVARRAKQLINGAKPLVDMDAQNPLTIAIEEVTRGLVTMELLDSVNIYLKEVNLLKEEENSEIEITEADEAEMELDDDEDDVEPVPEESSEEEDEESDESELPITEE